MTLYPSNARLPDDADDDIAYVRANFRPMDDALTDLVQGGALPQATYALPDGTPMVPVGHADLLDAADHDPAMIEQVFKQRYIAAGGDAAAASEEHQAWLGGGYGACLKRVTPEMIRAKDGLMAAIEALLASPRPDDPVWRTSLRCAVDALDAIEMPFAAHDRVRFGAPSSRDRLITATHERFPDLWSDDS